MRVPDLDRERSEQKLTLTEFMQEYNKNLPSAFPRVTAHLLREFQKKNPSLFKPASTWTLDQHRKKVMDWLPARLAAAHA